MKKLLLIAIVAIVSTTFTHAQNGFGVKAGFNSLSLRVSADGVSASESASGFYLGVFNNFKASDKVGIQAELQFVNVSEDGESSSVLALPVMANINVADKFNLLAGPQLDLLLDDDAEGIKKLGIGLGTGAAYDISQNVSLEVRYVLGLSNRLEDNEIEGIELDTKFNYLQIGLGYKF